MQANAAVLGFSNILWKLEPDYHWFESLETSSLLPNISNDNQ